MNDAHRSCEGKKRFESMPMARKIAKQLSRRKGVSALTYRCRICRGFHVGTHDRKRRDDRRDVEELEA